MVYFNTMRCEIGIQLVDQLYIYQFDPFSQDSKRCLFDTILIDIQNTNAPISIEDVIDWNWAINQIMSDMNIEED